MNKIDELTKKLNQIRLEFGDSKIANYKEFLKLLSKWEVPYNNVYVSAELYKLLENKRFPKTPFYINRISCAYETGMEKFRNSNKEVQKQNNKGVQEAIALLKSKGYRILKPIITTEYKEI